MAHGAGTANRAIVDWQDGLDVPPANLLHRLKRAWLDDHEEREYHWRADTLPA